MAPFRRIGIAIASRLSGQKRTLERATFHNIRPATSALGRISLKNCATANLLAPSRLPTPFPYAVGRWGLVGVISLAGFGRFGGVARSRTSFFAPLGPRNRGASQADNALEMREQ